MITTPEDYIKFLYEIQNSNFPTKAHLLPTDETIYEIDLNKRTIQAPEFLSVLKDHRAETIYFKLDRYYDNQDLSDTVCIIQYVNKNASTDTAFGHVYVVPYYDIITFKDEDKVLIPWMIDGAATAAAGPVEFSVRFYLLDSTEPAEQSYFIYSLNTQPAISKVLYGMDVVTSENENFIMPSEEIDKIWQRFKELEEWQNLTWLEADLNNGTI